MSGRRKPALRYRLTRKEDYSLDTTGGKMKDSESRDRAETTHENNEFIDTTKALIEAYKSAFGNGWERVFQETVSIDLSVR